MSHLKSYKKVINTACVSIVEIENYFYFNKVSKNCNVRL